MAIYVDGAVVATIVTAGALPNTGTPLNTNNSAYSGADNREPNRANFRLDEPASTTAR